MKSINYNLKKCRYYLVFILLVDYLTFKNYIFCDREFLSWVKRIKSYL